MKLYRTALISVILTFCIFRIFAQDKNRLEFSISYGIIGATDKLSYSYGFGKFTSTNKLEGTSFSASLLYMPKGTSFGTGYSVEKAEYGLFSREIDDKKIRIDNRHQQEFNLVSHGIIFRYNIRNKSIFRPFVSLVPSYNYFRIKLDSLSYTYEHDPEPTSEAITPISVQVTRPGHECSFGAIGFMPEIGINMVLKEKIGFMIKTGYTFITQKQTSLVAEKRNYFSFHFGVLYRFSDRYKLNQEP